MNTLRTLRKIPKDGALHSANAGGVVIDSGFLIIPALTLGMPD